MQAPERNDRTRLLEALAKAREPRLRERALALALDARIDGRDALALLEAALVDDANRPAAFAFVRSHFDALVAKLPEDTPNRLITEAGRLCTPADRSAFESFFKDRAARFNGGAWRYRQALEHIELCLAAHFQP